MFSVVSKSDTPVLPFVVQPESVTPSVEVGGVAARCRGYELPRFFNGEPDAPLRLAVALTAALMVQRVDMQGVVILAASRDLLAQSLDIDEALDRAVQIARTGKIVELAANRPAGETESAAILGITGGYHLGEFQNQGTAQYDGTGIFVLRADRFLLGAEILCPMTLALCQASLAQGEISSETACEGALDDLATLSFWDGFWTRTDNRAAVVIGEQSETIPVHIPARAQPLSQRSLLG